MKTTLIAVLLLIIGCSHGSKNKTEVQNINPNPKVVFTATEGIQHPESALYSPEHKLIFVSNIASGNPLETKELGYISKLSKEGGVLSAKWVTGLKAPKGLAVVKNDLFVSDVDRLVKIDINAGKISQTIKVKGAKFLNDVAADRDGNIYVSDMFDNAIYVFNGKKLNTWLKTTKLRSPNGLYIDDSGMMHVALWGSEIDMKTFRAKNPGTVALISLKDKKINEANYPSGHLDGIDADHNGNIWVSDWVSGDIYHLRKASVDLKFNLGQGSADISVAKDLALLLVPQMNENKVMGISLE